MSPSILRASPARLAACLLLAAAGSAGAQYKVVAPDGRVTYSDRAPSAEQGRVVTLNGRNAPADEDAALPFELRTTASRYPVTLYVAPSGCEPCESGRALLRKRGIPYGERMVGSSEDAAALEKFSGSREAPTLTIGAQVVRGYAPDLWNAYLDAAGYPRESKLPSNYAYKPPAPVVERTLPPGKPAAAAATPAAPALPPALPPAAASGIRF
jgi:glutaredoxin